MEPEVNDGQAEFEALAKDLENYAVGQRDAADLRVRTRTLAQQLKKHGTKGQKELGTSNPAVNALREATKAYQQRRPLELGKLLNQGNLLDVFVGDRTLGNWVFHHPEVIADEDATNWLDWLARPDCRAVIDDDLMRFVRVFFRTRRRCTWLPASRALARFAMRDEQAAREVRHLWERWRPDAVATSESSAASGTADRDTDEAIQAYLDRANGRHLERHVIHLACAWTAFKGTPVDLEGFDPNDPTRHLGESPDAADLSAALEGLLELVSANRFPAEGWPEIANRVARRTLESQTDDVLRRLHEHLAQMPGVSETTATIRERLVRPDWVPGRKELKERTLGKPTHWDMLWTWLETARWFLRRGDRETVVRMRFEAYTNGAGPAFDLAVDNRLPDGANHALDAALPRIRAVLEPDIWATTEGMRRTTLAVESWYLLHHSDIATLPWDATVRRALGWPARSLEGQDTLDKGLEVADGWRSQLVMAMPKTGAGFLVRDGEFPESLVATMAWKGNGLGTQAAVQTERLLRQASDAAQRVRCLWRILMKDPKKEFFTQLETVVRWNDAALVRLVRAVGQMDAMWDTYRNQRTVPASEYPAIANLYGTVAKRVAEVLGQQHAPERDTKPARWLTRICETLNDAKASREPDCPDWDDWLRTLLLGDDAGGGLCDWTDWLAQDWPAGAGPKPANPLRPEVEQFLPGFAESLERLRDERFQITARDIEDARRGLARLSDLSGRMAWPETAILGGVHMQLATWVDTQEARVAISLQGEELGHRLRQLIAQGREDAVVGLLEDEDADLVAAIPDSARLEAHQFLLEKINLRASYRLRKRFSFDSRFKPFYAHFAPLLAGVLGGPILVLDFGTYWNDAFKKGAALETVLLTVAAMLLAFLMMWGSLRPRRSRNHELVSPSCRASAEDATAGPGPCRLWLRAFGRLVSLFASAWALAALSAGLVLLTLRTTDLSAGLTSKQQFLQVFLWSGLSLFMGIFFQIVMEQRMATRDD